MAFHLTHCVALVPHTASLLSHQRKHRNWITPASRFSYFLHSHPVVLFVVFQPQYSPTSVRLNSSLEVSSVCVCPQFLSHFRHIFSDPKLLLQPAYSPTSVSHLLCEMGFFLFRGMVSNTNFVNPCWKHPHFYPCSLNIAQLV